MQQQTTRAITRVDSGIVKNLKQLDTLFEALNGSLSNECDASENTHISPKEGFSVKAPHPPSPPLQQFQYTF